jgi:hypothetical protein
VVRRLVEKKQGRADEQSLGEGDALEKEEESKTETKQGKKRE